MVAWHPKKAVLAVVRPGWAVERPGLAGGSARLCPRGGVAWQNK